jgi:TRAP-type C4-dicarboxylate transport system permease small subunit
MGAHDRDPGGVRGALIRLGNATAWLFAATFAIGVYEVVVRYAFNAPTNWVHVTSTALCVVAFAIAGGTAMAQDQHLRVTVLADRLRGPWQRAAQALALACGALYLSGLAWGLAREPD